MKLLSLALALAVSAISFSDTPDQPIAFEYRFGDAQYSIVDYVAIPDLGKAYGVKNVDFVLGLGWKAPGFGSDQQIPVGMLGLRYRYSIESTGFYVGAGAYARIEQSGNPRIVGRLEFGFSSRT